MERVKTLIQKLQQQASAKCFCRTIIAYSTNATAELARQSAISSVVNSGKVGIMMPSAFQQVPDNQNGNADCRNETALNRKKKLLKFYRLMKKK